MLPELPTALPSWHLDPGPGVQRIATLDMHTGGEPLRIVTAGLPRLPGNDVLAKRRWFREQLDDLRKALMWEPRGHADMYGAVIEPASAGQGDFDVFFLHNEGYSTMCGHAIIALTRWVLESGLKQVPAAAAPDTRHEVIFNVPCGRVVASASLAQGRACDIRFVNVPSFVLRQGLEVDVAGLGRVRCDVAYGGAFYALVDAASLGLRLEASDLARLIDQGRRIKHAVMDAQRIEHPFEPELSFLYGTIFHGPAQQPGRHSRNVCVFADGEVDRSATGSGVSARAALAHARGELRPGQRIAIESIVGSVMSVGVAGTERYGPHAAVRPEVGGSAHYSGRHEFWIDRDDPLHPGFLLR